ncbi:hypothetical protein ASG12_07310 [Williamsia sp. Leaf354]|uniref:GOLPH3/VPS74 family protein n=1 Tax=Williamsia sp. Leaf354 TaxID=1736349 RepID=UPI0006FE07F4|nr:GPP34 family phosphoprotein [Williamsia sp. Leaf354]KQS00665.1 hypothetical protein ASG12_07310 [Williamsia sp. Leaf354]
MNGVAERFILLALDPSTGEPLTQAGFADVAISGAFLADLALRDRITLTDDTITVIDDSPTGNATLDTCIATIAEKKSRDAGALITAFCPIAHRRRDEVFVEAEQAGLVEHLTRRHLWIYTTHRYKPVAGSTLVHLSAEVDRTITSPGASMTPEIGALIAVLDAAQIATRRFPGADPQQIEAARTGAWAQSAVRSATTQIQLAVMVAVMAATTAATTITITSN